MLVAMSSSLSSNGRHCSNHDIELRRGPWTAEEDNLLIRYIACHGEGRWSMVANRSGLRRTGKSCRLRWLNYLKPDLKHGNLSPEEQLLILKLHIKLGNRWSKIAKYLPGRTDNEIKNYWRTKVEKQARHLKIASNSKDFQQMIRCFWIPRLLQKIQRSQKESLQSAISVHESAATNNPGNGSSKIIESAKALDHHHHQINSTENNSSIESAKINQVLHISDKSENLFDATSTEIDYNPFEGYNFDSISYDMRLCSPEHFTETSNFCKDFSGYGFPGKDNYYYL